MSDEAKFPLLTSCVAVETCVYPGCELDAGVSSKPIEGDRVHLKIGVVGFTGKDVERLRRWSIGKGAEKRARGTSSKRNTMYKSVP